MAKHVAAVPPQKCRSGLRAYSRMLRRWWRWSGRRRPASSHSRAGGREEGQRQQQQQASRRWKHADLAGTGVIWLYGLDGCSLLLQEPQQCVLCTAAYLAGV